MITARFVSALALSSALVACGTARPAFLGDNTVTTTMNDGGVDSGPGLFVITPPPAPKADAGGLCGNQIIPLVVDHPNLYFILDASGSMSDPLSPYASKYLAARSAIGSLLQKIGSRVSYGAAVFPGAPGTPTNVCPVGVPVFPTTPGDPVSYALAGREGPVLTQLLRTLGTHSPNGLTPTAASLEALKSTLVGLPGKTYAILLTDGAPNCDPSVPCSADECTVNIEGGCGAPAGVNCCTPEYGYDYTLCLDADPTADAVADLASNGVQTFIVGMPGTSLYAGFLDRLASAGGTARASSPEYYPVASSTDLANDLEQIGSATISCDIPLQTKPPERDLVNVYFDQTNLPEDPSDGWTWASDDASVDTIRIVGNACTLLKAGDVLDVQVVAGCPTTER
jgi:hypothetical protein